VFNGAWQIKTLLIKISIKKIKVNGMMNHIPKIVIVSALSLLLFGCVASENLFETGVYVKKIEPHHSVFLFRLRAVEDNGSLKITGRLRLKGSLGINVPDYVEVSLLDKEGVEMATQIVSYQPKVLRGDSGRIKARFSAEFPKIPQPETVIRFKNDY